MIGQKENRKIKAIATMMRALSSETRLSVLYLLREKPRTWTELQLGLKLNPKSLRDHLRYLRDSELIRRRKPFGFELTEAGEAIYDLSMKDMLEATE